MSGKTPHKTKAAPKAKVTRTSRGARKSFASTGSFNSAETQHGHPPGPQGELVDEDRTGRFIGRFHGAGQPPLPKR